MTQQDVRDKKVGGRELRGHDAVDIAFRQEADALWDIASTCRDWIWQLDLFGCFTYCSPACEHLIGRRPADLLGRSYLSLVRPGAVRAVQRAFEAEQPFDCLRHGMDRADGSTTMLEASAAPVRTPDGAAKGFCGISRAAPVPAREMDDLLPGVSSGIMCAAAPVPLCLVDREGRFVAANARLADLFNLTAHDVVGRRVAEFTKQAAENVRENFIAFDAGEGVPDHELELRGRVYQVSVRGVWGDDGRADGLIAALTDITERRQAERLLEEANARLQAFAERDYLTGLLNRRRFDEVYALEVSAARRERAPVSLLLVDVDQFKLYNDLEGHLAGDECLRKVAQAIGLAVSRPRDVVCRFGGEEFVIVLPNTGVDGALVVADRVRRAVWDLGLPHPMSAHRQVSVSVGVSTLLRISADNDMAARRKVLLAVADEALYAAKDAGRNAVRAGPLLRD